MKKHWIVYGLLMSLCLSTQARKHEKFPTWEMLSTEAGDLEIPKGGNQQTCSVVADFDGDGINDFVIGERSREPSVLLYLRQDNGWKRVPIWHDHLQPEAGATAMDVDGDGDMDVIMGNDWSGNQVWWLENPAPNVEQIWQRHLIKNSGATKHHDITVGDFDGDGKQEILFWNQCAHTLFLARVPADPRQEPWDIKPAYVYPTTPEAPAQAEYLFYADNEHEGFWPIDMNGDGILDIVGGSTWYSYAGNDKMEPHDIDPGYHYSRCAAGQWIKGGMPEVALEVGDGYGPLNLYQYDKQADKWNIIKTLIDRVDNGHSLAIRDINGDGNADIWMAEMRLNGKNPTSRHLIFYGDGNGNILRTDTVSVGVDMHEAKLADLDGDGDLDILGKGYDQLYGNIHIWLNNGTGKKKLHHVVKR